MAGIYFEDGNNYNIKADKVVKVADYGNEIIIKDIWKKQDNLQEWVRQKGGYMLNKITGEIRECKKNENKIKSNDGFNRASNKLKDVIRCNFDGSNNELFVTLGYEEDKRVYDIELADKDFKKFWKKLKAIYKGLKYIYVIEEYAEGGWHLHCMLKGEGNKSLYIDNGELKRLWGKGFVWVERVESMTGNNYINVFEEEIKADGKVASVKSANVKFGNGDIDIDGLINYMAKKESKENIPAGKQIAYYSRGLKKVKVDYKVYDEQIKEMGNDYDFKKERTVLVKSEMTDKIIQKIKDEHYNKK